MTLVNKESKETPYFPFFDYTIQISSAMKKTRKATANGQIYLGNIPRNWAHQAITYMDKGELILRMTIEGLEVLFLWWAIQVVNVWNLRTWISFMICIVLVHTFNWITNGNFWALMLFAFPSLRNRGEAATCAYLNTMAQRLSSCKSISGIALFGSVSRNEWHHRSDIDIRILRKAGLYHLVVAVLLTMRERWLAVIARQPLDLFIADDVDFFKRMRSYEKPIFLLKGDPRLDKSYPDSQEVTLERLFNRI